MLPEKALTISVPEKTRLQLIGHEKKLNTRTPEHQNTRTPEHQNSRTAEQQNSRTADEEGT
ncbi:hypothetical protein ACR9H3_08890 [Enterobacter ludwigii]